jgi:hypothetical protein
MPRITFQASSDSDATIRQLIILVALVATAACGSNSLSEPLVTVNGTYTLKSMNGKPLPFVIASHDTSVTINTDVISLTAAGSWSEHVTYRQQLGAAAAATDTIFDAAGIWTRSGNKVTFLVQGGGVFYLGTASDTSLSLTDNSFAYLFVR